MKKPFCSVILMLSLLSVLFLGSCFCLTAYAAESGSQQIEIIRQPESQTVVYGKSLQLSLEVSGSDLSCQWYFKKDGATEWSKWRGRTNPCETVTPNESWNGIQLYCQITDGEGASVSSDTVTIHLLKPLKVLGSGDSICAGWRNSGKGFVGDLGLPYKNIGVVGATLSTKNTDVKNIPDRFLEFYHYHSPAVNPKNDGWEPDIIIAEGGINDYYHNAPLGTIPVDPVRDDAELAQLDDSTLTGGLQRLLYYMKAFYPHAEKYFLITHKTSSAFPKSKFNYLPETKNAAGYTQQDLHDVIAACCHTYDVTVIDVYSESFLDSGMPEYRSSTRFIDDPSVTDREYIDSDGIHPLSRGYVEGYVPLIKEHIHLYRPLDPPAFAITRQPESLTAELGDSITLSVKAQGIGLRYQWYFKKAGQESFSPWNNRKRAAETVTPPESWDGIQLYCQITDSSGHSLQSDTVTVRLIQEAA